MKTDTQKIWTLKLTGAEGESAKTVSRIPHHQMVDLLRETMHGFGPLEARARQTERSAGEDHTLAA
jgi:hypothetical protein